jgi:hypothetical protein
MVNDATSEAHVSELYNMDESRSTLEQLDEPDPVEGRLAHELEVRRVRHGALLEVLERVDLGANARKHDLPVRR